uniref:C-type lectin domain-containing protein n=2 Tax=Takifugu rubripes TaxID=31033 RepID=A0A3B5KAZ9_TAKRU
MMGPLKLLVFAALFRCVSASAEVCTNSLLPGAKGDQGETGEEGDQGKLGKNGRPGLPGVPGEKGTTGDIGHVGKMGPIGDRGDQGDRGLEGPTGFKGKPGTTCDCGRYRKVVAQLDISIGKLRNSVNFLKNVIFGLKETEESYYLLVKESKRYQEASVNCGLRGGSLAMPKTNHTNQLMAEYVSQAGLARVFIGVQAQSRDSAEGSSYVYADFSRPATFPAWNPEVELNSSALSSPNSSCVELLSTGAWAHVKCEAAMFFICEFPKSGRRGGGTGGGRMSPLSSS